MPSDDEEVMRPVPDFRGEATPLYPRYVGVEIECGSDADAGPPRSFWTALKRLGDVDEDGSICFQLPVEFKPHPARGAAFVDGINAACALLTQNGLEVNRSCGLHVHVDARDFTSSDVLKLVKLNTKIESALYGVVSRSRRRNTFSLPLGDEVLAPQEIIEAGAVININPKDPESGTAEQRARCIDINIYGSERTARYYKRDPEKIHQRYRGLNLTSIPLLGTVEFRHHQGTLNPRKILMWAALCSAVIEYAKNHTESEIHSLHGTPAEVLSRILWGAHLADVRAWVKARRAFFAQVEHGRRIPRGRTRPVEVEPPIDVAAEHAELEAGEVGARGRVGRRAHPGD